MVSLDFVVDQLGMDPSSFKPLTKLEQQGAIGVTGHRLVPDGAVYLTWYHKKSTRVFRNMRFLVVSNAAYDLILGARSIKEHSILDVPNLDAPPIPRLTARQPRDTAVSQREPPSTLTAPPPQKQEVLMYEAVSERDELVFAMRKRSETLDVPILPLARTANQELPYKRPLDGQVRVPVEEPSDEPSKTATSSPRSKMQFSRPSISQMLSRNKFGKDPGLLSAEEVS